MHVGGRQLPGRVRGRFSGRHLHGGTVRLRHIRATPCYYCYIMEMAVLHSCMYDIDFVFLLSDLWSVLFAYAGHVILGSVDGNRIWAKDLRTTQITHLEVKNLLDSAMPVINEHLGFIYTSFTNLALCSQKLYKMTSSFSTLWLIPVVMPINCTLSHCTTGIHNSVALTELLMCGTLYPCL